MTLTKNMGRNIGFLSKVAMIGIILSYLLACMSADDVQADKGWQTGFYLIAAEASTAGDLPQPNSMQQVVHYTNQFLLEQDTQPPIYLLLSIKPDVPLELARSPEFNEKGLNGFPELQIEMTKNGARALEKLTKGHLGQEIAFVVDGVPVTIHKIRSIITDGKFKLSRCTDTACQYIYSRLKAEQ